METFLVALHTKSSEKLCQHQNNSYVNWWYSSSDLIEFTDFGPENIRRYRKTLVVIDDFRKFVWTNHLKNKNARTIAEAFASCIGCLGDLRPRKPEVIETDVGKEFVKKISTIFLNTNNIERYFT